MASLHESPQAVRRLFLGRSPFQVETTVLSTLVHLGWRREGVSTALSADVAVSRLQEGPKGAEKLLLHVLFVVFVFVKLGVTACIIVSFCHHSAHLLCLQPLCIALKYILKYILDHIYSLFLVIHRDFTPT